MARALVLGNGKFLVTLDRFGLVRDMYYPYVGMENHVAGNTHRIGVWVNGVFSWVDDGSWKITIGYKPETMVGYMVYKNETLQVSMVMEDAVYNESNVFLRKVSVYNHRSEFINIRIFFHQVFLIGETRKRNTAFFDPTHTLLVHYRGQRVFIVNGRTEKGGLIDDFAVGTFGMEGKEGTFRDAEDGELSKNGVDHGSVDSVIRMSGSCESKEKAVFYYWVCAGQSLEESYHLNDVVITKQPDAMIYSTEQFWSAWLCEHQLPSGLLSEDQQKLYNTSLFVLRAHTDNRGSIIASADSAMIESGKDDYSYMWPRDAAFIASVLDKAGYTEVTKPFYRFCQNVLHPDGYLHHRYNADQSLGSTWHSALAQKEWLKNKILQLPIQEDETASVIYSLWNHYLQTKDVEFIEELYRPFIAKAADFLTHFKNATTGLPLASYDLWEERIGVSTYTCASVYGGLKAAAQFSELLGKRNHMRDYLEAAEGFKAAAIKYLYSDKLNSFIRYVSIEEDQVHQDLSIDASSLFGLWYFKMIDQTDPLFTSTQQQVMQRLRNPEAAGGIIRYENDNYFRDGEKSNPWIITTLWEAQRRLMQANVTEEDLNNARQTFDWVIAHEYPSGVLAEQLNPSSGESLSATPLVWSHATYIDTVLAYVDQLKKLHPLPVPPAA